MMPAFSRAISAICPAEFGDMVKADGGDDRDLRLHDISRVQPAAEANLDDGQISTPALELQERHRCHEFKKGRVLVGGIRRGPGGQRAEFVGVGDDFRLGEQAAIHLHAFAEFHQVRRGVEPGAPAGGVQDGVEHGRDRTLAVGAGNVDHRIAALGVVECRGEPAHPVDAKLRPIRLEGVEVSGDRRIVGVWFNHGCHG